jgi:hypothetical protein
MFKKSNNRNIVCGLLGCYASSSVSVYHRFRGTCKVHLLRKLFWLYFLESEICTLDKNTDNFFHSVFFRKPFISGNQLSSLYTRHFGRGLHPQQHHHHLHGLDVSARSCSNANCCLHLTGGCPRLRRPHGV